MRDLITQLLESERLAQGHSALQAEACDLAALARDLLQTQFEGRGVALGLDDTMAPVTADPTRMRLLLRNLVDNALRHGAGAATPPTLFLRTEADGRLALGVRDHGPGVAADRLQQLGEAFYRPDGARTRSTGGVGLGLTLCRRGVLPAGPGPPACHWRRRSGSASGTTGGAGPWWRAADPPRRARARGQCGMGAGIRGRKTQTPVLSPLTPPAATPSGPDAAPGAG